MDRQLNDKLNEFKEKGYSTLDEASAIELTDLAIIFYKKYSKRICEYFEKNREFLADSTNKEELEFFDYQTRLAVMICKKELEKKYQELCQGGDNNG